MKTFGADFLLGSILKFVHDVLVFATPQLFKLLVAFASSDEPMWKGVVYALLMLGCTSFQTICLGRYFYEMYAVGISMRAALTSAVYRKALRVSSASKKETTVGEIVNLMSVDVQRIVDL